MVVRNSKSLFRLIVSILSFFVLNQSFTKKVYSNSLVNSIQGIVFYDANGNGQKDAGEVGIEDWVILLENEVESYSTSTESNGFYEFTEIEPGNYILSEDEDEYWAQTFPASGTYSLYITSSSRFTNKNFGNYELGEISGFLFEDFNGNSVQDSSDVGLSGEKIVLWGTKDDSILTEYDGEFYFWGLPPGNYSIRYVHDNETIQTFPSGFPSPGYSFTTSIGSKLYNKNFGTFRYGKIQGNVFEDRNGDGIINPSEHGLSQWKVLITGTQNDSAITDIWGNYIFTGLHAGNYSVQQNPLHPWIQTFPGAPPSSGAYALTILNESGQHFFSKNFGNTKVGVIRGIVFHDDDTNGVQSENEYGIFDRKIILGGAKNETTYTDYSGKYSFGNLVAGVCTVRQEFSDDEEWVQTLPVDSSTNGHIIFVSQGSAYTNLNFGSIRLATLKGMVFDDNNGNSILDTSETGFQHCTVYLEGTQTDSVLTDSLGNYSFRYLYPGDYVVRIRPIPPWIQTYPGEPPATDVYSLSLSWGDIYDRINFGVTKNGVIRGIVFYDNDTNGVQGENEEVLPYWKIILSGVKDETTFTNWKGKYFFGDLDSGNYSLSQELPANWIQTFPETTSYHFSIDTVGTLIRGLNFGNIIDNTKFRTFKLDPLLGIKAKRLKRKKGEPAVEPNLANWREEVFYFLKKRKNPLTLGISQSNSLVWTSFSNGGVFSKFYYQIQTDSSYNAPFDSIRHPSSTKRKPLIKPFLLKGKSYYNPLVQAFGLFKLNILSSQYFVTPIGLGNLVYTEQLSPWDGMSLNEIARTIDTVLTFYKTKPLPEGDTAKVGSPVLEKVRILLNKINEAFDTTISLSNGDSLVSTQGLRFPGLIEINSIPFLQKTSIGKVDELHSSLFDSEFSERFSLHQNYPNPFNPTTTFTFDVPKDANVEVSVFDILGRKVTTLLNEKKLAGTYQIEWNATTFSSGVYFVKMKSDGFTETRKVVLTK